MSSISAFMPRGRKAIRLTSAFAARGNHTSGYRSGTRLPLAQVAALSGFSEQSALTRYCRRCFGRTPSAIRAEAA